MQKPPLPPKPKLYQSPELSPSVPRKNGLSHPSPGMQRKKKPVPLPKPRVSKPTNTVESKLFQTSVLNSQNGIQQDKNPDWDYIISICLCPKDNCTCSTETSANTEKVTKDLALYNSNTKEDKESASAPFPDHRREMIHNTSPTNTRLVKHNTLQETQSQHNLNMDEDTSHPEVTIMPSISHRKWSDEAAEVSSRPRPEEDAVGLERTSTPPAQTVPTPPRKPSPTPVPRKPRTSVCTFQEEVEKEKEEVINQNRWGENVKEIKVSSDGRDTSSSPVSVTFGQDGQTGYISGYIRDGAPPVLPPRNKSFPYDYQEVQASALQTPPQDVIEEDLGWDSDTYERGGKDCRICGLEVSADQENEETLRKGPSNKEVFNHNLVQFRPISGSDMELSQPPAIPVTQKEKRMDMIIPKTPHRLHALKKEVCEERGKGAFEVNEIMETSSVQDFVYKEEEGELPLPPYEGSNQNPSTTTKPRLPNLKKARSFTDADIIRSLGQKFQKISAKMPLPKQGQVSDSTASNESDEYEHLPVHESNMQKSSCPLIQVEQSVDGDEDPYENDAVYEDISDWQLEPIPPPTPWQYSKSEEGINESLESYGSFIPAPISDDRSLTDVDEDVRNDGLSNDEFAHDTSFDDEFEDEFEDDECSSISSKGDDEQPMESTIQSEKKKTEIHHIATEIMTSEETFVDVLKLLHVDFRNAVAEASRKNGKPVIEEHVLNQILYYLPQLYELNQNLLTELQQRLEKWDENPKVADIFLKKGPFLKMYSTYIHEFDRNAALLVEQTKKNLAFGSVVREFEATPRCASLALQHHLLKPVQRIPQYQLLLTGYLKNLSPDSVDYKDTQDALVVVKEVANHANDLMKQGDNSQKIISVQCRLTGHPEIIKPGRIFLKEGMMMKLSRKVMQPRMFFLFNDVLLFTIPAQAGQYKLKHMLSLDGMKVSKPSQEAYQNELNIVSVERSFILSASSATEQDQWLKAISTAISDFKKEKGNTPGDETPGDGSHLGSKAPIWIPDNRTSMCMICTSKFTKVFRRHHCRACGKVVCQDCSSNKCPLEYLKYKYDRVCDQCYNLLAGKTVNVSGERAKVFTIGNKKREPILDIHKVPANTENSSMSGYLLRSKGSLRKWAKHWFVIKDKVLYTYAASEDVVALESLPLLGYDVKVDPLQKRQFMLYHKRNLYYRFKLESAETAERWISSFKEATVL
ncbi:FYVE, RhoGEF and PH domain-containing protein 6-like isoform 1-T1 [Pholidichthys leucotaenia]